jgi:hypothetical protein
MVLPLYPIKQMCWSVLTVCLLLALKALSLQFLHRHQSYLLLLELYPNLVLV